MKKPRTAWVSMKKPRTARVLMKKPRTLRAGRRCMATASLAWTLPACELIEETTEILDSVVVAEVYVHAGKPEPGHTLVFAFLHGTLHGEALRPVSGAAVTITDASGRALRLSETDTSECVVESARVIGSCYHAGDPEAVEFEPGSTLFLDITLADGGKLTSQATLPGDFEVLAPSGSPCRLAPSTPLQTAWTKSAGARAYVNETLVYGMGEALEINRYLDGEPVEMVGVSATEADTAALFPDEYGTFSRFDLEPIVARALVGGLPDGTQASVAVVAIDRNYVNWARGGDFNPSGEVRRPSITGDGTGVFGASVTKYFQLEVSGATQGLPACEG